MESIYERERDYPRLRSKIGDHNILWAGPPLPVGVRLSHPAIMLEYGYIPEYYPKADYGLNDFVADTNTIGKFVPMYVGLAMM